jgi:sulfate adenylyltransferase
MGVYYRNDRALLASLSITMRYAGPKASLFLAIVRKNFGCTHYIVGRDQAGARDASGKNYYEPYECHEIFDEYDIGIIPMKFVEVFFCTACKYFASSKTCPHEQDQHMFISQTKIRQMLKEGRSPPPEIIKPEVAKILSGKDIFVD